MAELVGYLAGRLVAGPELALEQAASQRLRVGMILGISTLRDNAVRRCSESVINARIR